MKTKETARIVGFGLIVIVIGMFLTGCVSPQPTEIISPVLPQGQDAVLIVGVGHGRTPFGLNVVEETGIYIKSVDGVKFKHGMNGWRGSLRLLPGKHTISFGFSNGYQFSTDESYNDIYVEAGKTYRATPFFWTDNKYHKDTISWRTGRSSFSSYWKVLVTEEHPPATPKP
jgi:hypothetical protein